MADCGRLSEVVLVRECSNSGFDAVELFKETFDYGVIQNNRLLVGQNQSVRSHL